MNIKELQSLEYFSATQPQQGISVALFRTGETIEIDEKEYSVLSISFEKAQKLGCRFDIDDPSGNFPTSCVLSYDGSRCYVPMIDEQNYRYAAQYADDCEV